MECVNYPIVLFLHQGVPTDTLAIHSSLGTTASHVSVMATLTRGRKGHVTASLGSVSGVLATLLAGTVIGVRRTILVMPGGESKQTTVIP